MIDVNAKVFSLLQSSATTNDTVTPGSDIATALKGVYPSIQDTDIDALISVCKPHAESKMFQS